MKLPKYVNIMGHRVPVQRKMYDPDAIGVFVRDGRSMKIAIVSTLEESLAEETLIHEIIEAANYIAELNLKHHQIQTLGAIIHQALRPSLRSR